MTNGAGTGMTPMHKTIIPSTTRKLPATHCSHGRCQTWSLPGILYRPSEGSHVSRRRLLLWYRSAAFTYVTDVMAAPCTPFHAASSRMVSESTVFLVPHSSRFVRTWTTPPRMLTPFIFTNRLISSTRIVSYHPPSYLPKQTNTQNGI
jgi:hypothetical protein